MTGGGAGSFGGVRNEILRLLLPALWWIFPDRTGKIRGENLALGSETKDPEAVKHIEYYPSGGTYTGDKITPELIQKILKKVPKGIGIYLSLDPDGECDWLEVVSDGEWLFLGYCFQDETGRFDNWYSYNPDFADTMEQIQDADFSDRNIYTPIDSGGQSPIPKIQAITDMDAGVKAVEYFIRTGKRYPGIDWMC